MRIICDVLTRIVDLAFSPQLWLVLLVIITGLCLVVCSRARRIVLKFLGVAVLVIVAVCAAYVVFFDHVGQLKYVNDGDQVFLVGRVRDVSAGEDAAKFVIADPTGQTPVITQAHAPNPGDLVFVQGRKGSFHDETGEPRVWVLESQENTFERE